MNPFLSCDWGTSSFRLSLVNPENFNVIESEYTNKGILTTYNEWKATLNEDPLTRLSFYLDTINEHIKAIEKKSRQSLDGIPLLLSGMASSSIGMMPLPYLDRPFPLDGSAMLSELILQTHDFKHDTLLISGVRTGDDVMRGEETQLIGIFSADAHKDGEQLYIFPGTHSKHIVVKGSHAMSFKTYMTGEIFDLLAKKSILHSGLEEGSELQTGAAKESFKKAVIQGAQANLLNACFTVRTNSLFDKLTKKENYHYLSGLLIGAELKGIAYNDTIGIYLCCGEHLKVQYETALEVLGLKTVHAFSAEEVSKAAIKGQYKIYEKYINR